MGTFMGRVDRLPGVVAVAHKVRLGDVFVGYQVPENHVPERLEDKLPLGWNCLRCQSVPLLH